MPSDISLLSGFMLSLDSLEDATGGARKSGGTGFIAFSSHIVFCLFSENETYVKIEIGG